VSPRTYQQALDYLYSFIDYSLQRNFTYETANLDLRRVIAFLELLGNPHQRYPVIHVAGTKGKGSVSAMIASALKAAGYRTGLYTSPHMIDFCERIRINGKNIDTERLAQLVDQMEDPIQQIPALTTFELMTSLGFLYFAEEQVDAAVIEVGLGGRLDATNVVDPLVSVITSLSYDHTKILGNTLAEIAMEKAGIIKPGIPFVSAPQEAEALKVLSAVAETRKSRMVLVGRDWHFAPHRRSLEGQSFYLWPASDQEHIDRILEQAGELEWVPARFEIPLLGHHQIINAATAYAALRTASDRGLSISEDDVRSGFLAVQWPGRFQVLQKAPYVVLDSAHNRDSARKLRTALDDYFPLHRVVLLFGASEDKDIDGMLDEMLPRVDQVVVTQTIHPRAASAEKLAEKIRERGCPVESAADPASALAQALHLCAPEDVLLVAGSVFMAAAVLAEWPAVRDTVRSNEPFPRKLGIGPWIDVEHERTRIS
jgi:dihydrofolate synthase / folylpolyglutamate synthase